MTLAGKKLSDYLPPLAQQGMDYLCATDKAGISIQTADLTLGGATTATTFAALSLSDMEDATYSVAIGGEYVLIEGTPNLAPVVDLSTRTTAGFSVINGTVSNVVQVIVVGRLTGQSGD